MSIFKETPNPAVNRTPAGDAGGERGVGARRLTR